MTDEQGSSGLDRTQSLHRFMRLILRALPIVPASELYDLLTDLRKSRAQLGDKVTRAVESLQEASELVTELETELSERMTKAEHLRKEYEKYSQLAQIEEERAAAVIKQIQQTVDKGKSSERWISFGINIAAGLVIFVVGVLLGPLLTRLLGITQ